MLNFKTDKMYEDVYPVAALHSSSFKFPIAPDMLRARSYVSAVYKRAKAARAMVETSATLVSSLRVPLGLVSQHTLWRNRVAQHAPPRLSGRKIVKRPLRTSAPVETPQNEINSNTTQFPFQNGLWLTSRRACHCLRKKALHRCGCKKKMLRPMDYERCVTVLHAAN